MQSSHLLNVPGVEYCGEPPAISEPGSVVVSKMEAVYKCPEDMRLAGVEKRVCNDKIDTPRWEPTVEQSSLCLAD